MGPTYVFTESPALIDSPPGQLNFINGSYNFINHPLVEQTPNGEISPIIHSMQVFDLSTGFNLSEVLALNFATSIAETKILEQGSQYGLTDSKVQLKYNFYTQPENFLLSLLPEAILPTGNTNHFLSSGNFGWSLRFLAEKQFSFLKLGANLGYRNLKGSQWRELNYSSQYFFSLAAAFLLSDSVTLNVEGSGYIATDFNEFNSPGEYYIGGSFKYSERGQLFAGISTSDFSSDRNDGMRAILGLKYRPTLNDQHTKNETQCSNRPMTLTLPSRRPTADEMKSLLPHLPYNTNIEINAAKGKKKISAIPLGEMSFMTSSGLPIVENSQVIVAFDTEMLPLRSSVKKIHSINLKMTASKISQEKYLKTEILCFPSNKICSGTPISDPLWQEALNKSYFDKETPNTYFSDQFLSKKVGAYEGRPVFSSEITLSVEKLFNLASEPTIDQFYKKSIYSPKGSTFFVVVAEDTFVSNDSRIEFSLQVEECR